MPTKPTAIGAKAPFPHFVAPALATSIGNAPNGDRWIHEIKFDGIVSRGKVRHPFFEGLREDL